jgi:hypothetical protein
MSGLFLLAHAAALQSAGNMSVGISASRDRLVNTIGRSLHGMLHTALRSNLFTRVTRMEVEDEDRSNIPAHTSAWDIAKSYQVLHRSQASDAGYAIMPHRSHAHAE